MMIETYQHVLTREYTWQACNIAMYDRMGFDREADIWNVIIQKLFTDHGWFWLTLSGT
jgi:hypothetical protein